MKAQLDFKEMENHIEKIKRFLHEFNCMHKIQQYIILSLDPEQKDEEIFKEILKDLRKNSQRIWRSNYHDDDKKRKRTKKETAFIPIPGGESPRTHKKNKIEK